MTFINAICPRKKDCQKKKNKNKKKKKNKNGKLWNKKVQLILILNLKKSGTIQC